MKDFWNRAHRFTDYKFRYFQIGGVKGSSYKVSCERFSNREGKGLSNRAYCEGTGFREDTGYQVKLHEDTW